MNRIATFAVLAIVFSIFTTTATATELPSYLLGTNIDQEFRVPGLNARLSAENLPAETYTWTDSRGNVWTDEDPARTNGNLDIYVNQEEFHDFYESYLLPVDMNMYFSRWNNEGDLHAEVEFSFLLWDELLDVSLPPQASMNFNAFGMTFGYNGGIQQGMEWSWPNGYDQEPLIEETDNLRGDFWYWFHNTETTYANLSVNDSNYRINGVNHDCLNINGYFDLKFTGTQEELYLINSQVELIPEPCTFALLTFGAIAAIAQRRRP